VSDNPTSRKRFRDLNFKVDPALYQAFKITAAHRAMKMKELLRDSYWCWFAAYGDPTLRSLLPEELRNLAKVRLQPRSGNALDC
jgi:hypothetical protein